MPSEGTRSRGWLAACTGPYPPPHRTRRSAPGTRRSAPARRPSGRTGSRTAWACGIPLPRFRRDAARRSEEKGPPPPRLPQWLPSVSSPSLHLGPGLLGRSIEPRGRSPPRSGSGGTGRRNTEAGATAEHGGIAATSRLRRAPGPRPPPRRPCRRPDGARKSLRPLDRFSVIPVDSPGSPPPAAVRRRPSGSRIDAQPTGALRSACQGGEASALSLRSPPIRARRS